MLTNDPGFIVFVDSGVLIRRDMHLSSPVSEVLFEAHRSRKIHIYIPELVILEVVNKHREREEQAGKDFIKSIQGLSALNPGQFEGAQGDVKVASLNPEFERGLRERLDEGAVQILPLPSVPHEELVSRALARRRPFDPKGKDGYRDCLIWENFLEAIEGETAPVLFLTTDSKAFGSERDPEALHEHLVKEMTDRGLDPEQVTLVDSLDQAVKRAVEPAEEVRQAFQEKLSSDILFRTRIKRMLIDIALDTNLNSPDLSPWALVESYPEEVSGEREILALRSFGDPIVTEARQLSTGDAVVELQLSAEAITQVVFDPKSRAALANLLMHSWSETDQQSSRARSSLESQSIYPARLIFEAKFDLETTSVPEASLGHVFLRPTRKLAQNNQDQDSLNESD